MDRRQKRGNDAEFVPQTPVDVPAPGEGAVMPDEKQKLAEAKRRLRALAVALGVSVAVSAFRKDLRMGYGFRRAGPWTHTVTPFGRAVFS
jgi:hypothetical protein